MNKVLLIYTGGTIGMGQNPQTGALEPLDFNHLEDSMPEFNLIRTNVDVYQFTPPIDSSDMKPKNWAQLVRIIARNYDQYDGFVVLHGTDTMAYTASALSFMLENLTKPVILTGSQLPIGQLRTDGKENLITSIELAAMKDKYGHARVPEVCIYFSGRLLRGNRSTKINAEGFFAFDSFNYPHLCDAGVNFTFHDHHILNRDFSKPMIPHYAMDENVLVFSIFPGIQERIFRNVLNSSSLRGMVVRTFGSGNAPHNYWLMPLLRQAAQMVTQDTARSRSSFEYRIITFCDVTFQILLLTLQVPRRGPTTPAMRCHKAGLGSSPVARHYWGNHCYFLFLQVLRCFSSLG